MATAPTKQKGAPTKAAAASQSSNQPKGEVKDPNLDPETANPNESVEREELTPPPVDNDYVEEGAEKFDEPETTSQEPEPDEPPDREIDPNEPGAAQTAEPAGLHPSTVAAINAGSTSDPITGRPIDPVTRRPVGVTEDGTVLDLETGKPVAPNEPPRSLHDRIRDVETRWEKDFEEVILDIHDHIFGTSATHEETTEKRKAAEEAAKKPD